MSWKKMFQYFKLLNSRSKTHIRELYTLHSNCSIGFHHCVLMLNSNTSCECTMVLNLTLYCQHLYWSIDQITDNNTHSTHAMWVIHRKHDNTAENIHLSLQSTYHIFNLQIFISSSFQVTEMVWRHGNVLHFDHSCMFWILFLLSECWLFFNIYTSFPKYFLSKGKVLSTLYRKFKISHFGHWCRFHFWIISL